MQLIVGALVVVLLGGGSIAAANLLVGSPAGTPAGTARPQVSRPPASFAPPPPEGRTYRDFLFETNVITAPTATKAQSKVWFAHGTWWAALVQPAHNQLNIFRLDRATQLWEDTGTLIDDRPFADADFLYTGDHLYVVSAGPRPSRRHEARVLRYSYDAEARRFSLDPNFPVKIAETGATAAVISQDGQGVLWVSYQIEGQIWLAHSLNHDAHWSAPFPLPLPEARVDPKDIASSVAFGPGRLGVMWSNQLDDNVYFSVHRDGDPPDAWSAAESVMAQVGSSDDHINLKTYPLGEGTGVVAALKTSLDDGPSVNGLDPLILLTVRDADGRWSETMFGQVRDHHTRPVVMVDSERNEFYVAATSPSGGGAIYYKRTPIDQVAFNTGLGVPLVRSERDLRINNTSTSKQWLTPESGLLVVASDDDTGRYLHAVVDLGGGLPTVDPGAVGRPDVPAPPDPRSPVTWVWNDFEPWPVGDPAGTGFTVRETDPPDSLSIVDDGDGGRALRVSPSPAGPGVRACRAFPDVPEGTIRASVLVRVNDQAPNDATILALRGSGGETASVRATDRGVFAWFDGATKVRSSQPVRVGAWYRVTATVDQANRTWSFLIETADGSNLLRARDLDWRAAPVRSARSLCVENGSGAARQSLDLAEITVRYQPPE